MHSEQNIDLVSKGVVKYCNYFCRFLWVFVYIFLYIFWEVWLVIDVMQLPACLPGKSLLSWSIPHVEKNFCSYPTMSTPVEKPSKWFDFTFCTVCLSSNCDQCLRCSLWWPTKKVLYGWKALHRPVHLFDCDTGKYESTPLASPNGWRPLGWIDRVLVGVWACPHGHGWQEPGWVQVVWEHQREGICTPLVDFRGELYMGYCSLGLGTALAKPLSNFCCAWGENGEYSSLVVLVGY